MGKTLKPARTFDEQISILENRNMAIGDRDRAMKTLSNKTV